MENEQNTLAAIALQSIRSKVDNKTIDQMKVAAKEKRSNFDYYERFTKYFDSFLQNTKVFTNDLLIPKYSQSELNITIDFFFTESPQAFTLFVKEDNSYAIGIDFRYIILMQEVGFAAIDAVSTGSINEPISREAMIGFQLVFQNNMNQINGVKNDNIEKYANIYLEYQRQKRGWNEITQGLTLYTSWFIVAHEFGHIVLNHFEKEDISLLHLLDNSIKADEISTFAHKKEYDADKWAFTCLQNEFSNKDYVENYEQMTPLIFFAIYDIIQSLSKTKSNLAAHVFSSHPSWKNRFDRLEKLQLENRKTKYQYINNIITPLENTPIFIYHMKEIILNNPIN